MELTDEATQVVLQVDRIVVMVSYELEMDIRVDLSNVMIIILQIMTDVLCHVK